MVIWTQPPYNQMSSNPLFVVPTNAPANVVLNAPNNCGVGVSKLRMLRGWIINRPDQAHRYEFHMVDRDIGVAPNDQLTRKDNDSENDVEDDDTETASFMAVKSSKDTCSSKNGGGTGKKSLYERWKDDYDDNPYDDDEECEYLTEDLLAFMLLMLVFMVKLDVSYVWFSFLSNVY
nr:hypothetical protein [Tanacetum cinerariifolium]